MYNSSEILSFESWMIGLKKSFHPRLWSTYGTTAHIIKACPFNKNVNVIYVTHNIKLNPVKVQTTYAAIPIKSGGNYVDYME